MAWLKFGRIAALAAVLAAGVAAAAPARAGVISSTPTLPLLGVPYEASLGFDCFPLAHVCVTGGEFTLTSLISSTFNAAGQDIKTGAVFTGMLTTLSHVPFAPITLSGTVEQEVLGRTSATQTGSWTTDLLSLSLSGLVLGQTGTMELDSGHSSTGVTSITPIVSANTREFVINSFFDVFLELSLGSLSTTQGPIRVAIVGSVPEPSGIAVLAMGLLGMLALCRRRGAAFPATSST